LHGRHGTVAVVSPLNRRQLLLGGAAGLVLTACGSGGDQGGSTAGGSSTTTDAPEVAGGLVLYKVFQPQQPVGVPVRLPLALASQDGDLDITVPERVTVRLRPPEGGSAPGPFELEHHAEGIPRGYYPLRAELDAPGAWGIVVEADGVQVETTIEAVDPTSLPAVPGPGDPLVSVPTPTIEQARGVDPICTREPDCPFHEVSLDEAIGGTGPIVLLVSTPAFCQTAICGPVLDLLIDRRADLEAAGAAIVHAEVYVDERARQVTATVDAFGLTYEPALFLAAPDGTVTERLDYTYDATELDAALARLVP
jgi:hypothetical protein